MFYDQYCLFIDVNNKESCKIYTNQLVPVTTNFSKPHPNLEGICGSPTEKSMGLMYA